MFAHEIEKAAQRYEQKLEKLTEELTKQGNLNGTLEAKRRLPRARSLRENWRSKLAAVKPQAFRTEDYVGRFLYEHNGVKFIREFRKDGTAHLYKEGEPMTAWAGKTWRFTEGYIVVSGSKGATFNASLPRTCWTGCRPAEASQGDSRSRSNEARYDSSCSHKSRTNRAEKV